MRRPGQILFIASVFLSALLLFLVEPMIGRLLLPEYGGTPGVWNGCMVCFQALLLAGYAWAHWSGAAKGRVLLHGVILLASLAVVPFALPAPGHLFRSDIASVLIAVVLTAGLPFTLLASNSSLVQRWYSAGGGGDPFWLYAMSNTGSLIGLLGYPVFFEPWLGLSTGWRTWVALYVVFIVVSLALIAITTRTAWGQVERGGPSSAMDPPPRSAAAGWVFRAAVASSLLLSVTMKITTDLAPAPVFWVIPLALYLATFILAFSQQFLISRYVLAALTATGIAVSIALDVYIFAMPFQVQLVVLLGTLFFGSLLCHADLFASRPSPQYLTQFYLWIAAGGAIGGILNTLVAPLLFRNLAEYPITLVCLAVVIHSRGGYLAKFPRERLVRAATWLPGLTFAVALAVSAMVIGGSRREPFGPFPSTLWDAMPLVVVLAGLLFSRHAGQFEVAVACVAVFSFTGRVTAEPTIAQVRSFFGIMKVYETPSERVLLHGTTIHGSQWRSSTHSTIPTHYYYPTGPLGMALRSQPPRARIGIVGLGAGTLAALGRPGDDLSFFEIDHDVLNVARKYFTYLRDSRSRVTVKIGDGRLLLRDEPDRSFDLLVLDAFSSDAIPTHLLTAEALDLYLSKVKPSGLVVAHISNRHLDLTRVFRGWSAREHRPVVIFLYYPNVFESSEGASKTLAVAFAPDRRTLQRMIAVGKWHWLAPGRSVSWTDDRIDILAALGHAM